jgi:hypothetical protein
MKPSSGQLIMILHYVEPSLMCEADRNVGDRVSKVHRPGLTSVFPVYQFIGSPEPRNSADSFLDRVLVAFPAIGDLRTR